MLDFIELGFKARKKFYEKLELKYFKEWCKENNIESNNNFDAEILWETNLSKLKIKKINMLLSK